MLDTNFCIHLIRKRPPEVFERLEQQFDGDVVMSSIIYAELRAGLEMRSTDREQDETALRTLVTRVPVKPFTPAPPSPCAPGDTETTA